ncbi:MAG: ParB/RepB/Spo0J family partition protein [Alphaproteobacteria bacterium]
MIDERPNQRLGRGLSALFQDEGEDYAALDRLRQAKTVPIDQLRPSPFQPRRKFDAEDMSALVESIRDKGVLQPILVRRSADSPEAYEIVAGERRWRAAQVAQLHDVPVIVRDLTDRDTLEVALVENVQRSDLTAVEEGQAYRRLIEEFGYTQEALAQAIGKSRSHVANIIRLTELPEPVLQMLDSNQLSAGHARALLSAADPAALARKVVRKGLNVRQTEALVRRERTGTAAPPHPGKDANTAALENELSQALGLRVTIDIRGQGGTLGIHYATLEQLDDVLHRLKQGAPRRPE